MRYKSTNEATCIGFAVKIVVSHFVFENALHAQQRAGVEISNRELRELGHRVASSAKNVGNKVSDQCSRHHVSESSKDPS